jgi:hypothetical protein
LYLVQVRVVFDVFSRGLIKRCRHEGYKEKTGNDNLRRHLMNKHDTLYREECEKNAWKYPGSKDEKKPTIGENRKAALPPFSPETFLEYLVRFITADDQVRHTP